MPTMSLECVLTDQDVKNKKDEIVSLLNNVESLESECERHKAKAKSAKASQGEVQGQIAQLRVEINERSERREVKIYEEIHGKFMVTKRGDTDDQVSKRRLSASELGSENKKAEEEKETTEAQVQDAKKSDAWAVADDKAGDEDE